VTWASSGGWVLGHTVSTGHRNVAVRIAQSRAAFDDRRRLAFARTMVVAKIRNSRVFISAISNPATKPSAIAIWRRCLGWRTGQPMLPAKWNCLDSRGAGACYFRLFQTMFGEAARDFRPEFSFGKRTRRPPAGPVNAMLSLGYALVTRTWLAVLSAVGFDPYVGFYGRLALALDMMEPFRPILADSTVIQVIINNGESRWLSCHRNGSQFAAAGATCVYTCVYRCI
jgi:CRISPR-associated protein Cas1